MIDRIRHAAGDGMDLRIELGRAKMTSHEAGQLAAGSIVTLDTLVDQPVDIVAGGQLIARGEVMVLDGSFCVRITELVAGKKNP